MAPTFIGTRTRELRQAARLTQQDLAYRAGLAIRTISMVENGARVKASTLDAIAAALGVAVDELAPDMAAELREAAS